MVTHALYRFWGRRPQRSCHSCAIVGRACTTTVTYCCWCSPCSHTYSSVCQVSPLRMAAPSSRSRLCARKSHARSGASIRILLCVTLVCSHPSLSLDQCALVAFVVNSRLELKIKLLLLKLLQCWMLQWFLLVPVVLGRTYPDLCCCCYFLALSRLIGRVPASSKNQPSLPGAWFLQLEDGVRVCAGCAHGWGCHSGQSHVCVPACVHTRQMLFNVVGVMPAS